MIYDHRTYNLVPLKMGKWLALYEECALPVQQKYLGNLIGFFQTEIGTLNQVVHLWGFVQDDEVRNAYRVAAENVPGVRRVKNHLRSIPAAVTMGV